MDATELHHIYHYERAKPTIKVEADRNSKGVTWTVGVVGATGVEEAMTLFDQTVAEMRRRFPENSNTP